MSEKWMPKVGDWVVYAPKHGEREDGEVVEVLPPAMARVRYRGDRTAKATYLRDLEPGLAAPVRPEAGA